MNDPAKGGWGALAPDHVPEAYFRRRGLSAGVHVLATTTSTQDVAHELAASGAPAGTAVLAGYQETGRGRLGRTWSAPPGTSLAMSIILRTGGGPDRQSRVPMAAGLAALDALEALAGERAQPVGNRMRSGLKWPNDVMLRGPENEWRKAGGILVEKPGDGDAIIVGVGINVYQTAAQLPPQATSLAESGWLPDATAVDRTASRGGTAWPGPAIGALAAELVAALLDRSARLDAGDEPAGEYRARLITLAHYVHATRADGSIIAGLAVDVDADGALVIMDAWGLRRAIHAGDVTLGPQVEDMS